MNKTDYIAPIIGKVKRFDCEGGAKGGDPKGRRGHLKQGRTVIRSKQDIDAPDRASHVWSMKERRVSHDVALRG